MNDIDIRIFEKTEEWLRLFSANGTTDLTALARVVKTGTSPVTKETLSDFFSHGGVLAVASDKGRIVGAACLVRVHKYNGFTYRIEHVSVLPEFQGQGMARKLMSALHGKLVSAGRYVDLTSEPTRVAANRLYESLGYHLRNTHVRRYVIAP